jgi:hypothetical protein
MNALEQAEKLLEENWPKGYALSVDEESSGVFVRIWDNLGFRVPGLWVKGRTRGEATKKMLDRLRKIAFMGYDEDAEEDPVILGDCQAAVEMVREEEKS